MSGLPAPVGAVDYRVDRTLLSSPVEPPGYQNSAVEPPSYLSSAVEPPGYQSSAERSRAHCEPGLHEATPALDRTTVPSGKLDYNRSDGCG